MARRPFNLIGRDSALELCPYVATVAPGSRSIQSESAIRSAGHIDQVSLDLMRRLSGESRPEQSENNSWTLVGAGSLGSKIGLHLARSGCGPSVVVDHDMLAPHNYARHALLTFEFERFAIGQRQKAEAMADAIRSLASDCTPVAETGLFASGEIGYVTVEGEGRNPNSEDLKT